MKFSKTCLIAIGTSVLPLSHAEPTQVDCSTVKKQTKSQIVENSSRLLEILTAQISTNSSCACDIVKIAIVTTDPTPEQVASIVEAAADAAPDQLRLIAQCAIAVAPDSLTAVQKIVAKYDQNAGESPSGKNTERTYSAKEDAKGVIPPSPREASSPLDFPVGPDGSGTPEVIIPPFFIPPIAPPSVGITPPDVTIAAP